MFIEWPIFSEADFTEKCRNLYFCTTGYSPAHFIIVNSGLYFLFAEQSDIAPEHKAAELRRYSSLCRSNFERALEKLHLLITPSLEACQALILGVFSPFYFKYQTYTNICRHFLQPSSRSHPFVYV